MSSATIFHDNLLFQIKKMIKRFFVYVLARFQLHLKGNPNETFKSCARLLGPMKFIEVKNIISRNASVSNGILRSICYDHCHTNDCI